MKKLLAIVLSLLMVLSMVACTAQEAPEAEAPVVEAPATEATEEVETEADPYADLEPIELIGADTAGKGAAGQLLGEAVAAKVAEITGGKLTIDYHPNGELGGDADLLRQAKDGDIDIVVAQTAPIVSFIPEMAVFDLPMVFATYTGEEIDAVINGDNEFTQALEAGHAAAGYHMLGFLQNATYRLTTTNTELRTLEDFAGLQIRTMENANHMAFWTAIDAQPTPLAWAEVYFALQSGMLGAQENAADTCLSVNFQEVQKYLCLTNHILYNNEILIGKAGWDKLAPAYQEALTQAVEEAIAEQAAGLVKLDADSKAALEAGGMEIISYDADFYAGVLADPEVQQFYKDIDTATNGLATVLQAELAK